MFIHIARTLGLLSLVAAAPLLWADVITLKNGDRLTGKLIKSDEKEVLFESDLAGKVKVALGSVRSLESSEPLTLMLQDGTSVVGELKAAGDEVVVKTPGAVTLETTRDQVAAIRSQPEQEIFLEEQDRILNPRFVDPWAGTFDAGYAATRGNASTNTVNIAANAVRATRRDKLTLTFTSIRTNARVANEQLTTANAVRGGFRYDRNLSAKSFLFGLTDLEFDQFQRLDLRAVIGSGGGYHAWKREHSSFDLFGGANVNKEYFSTGLERNSAEALFGDELNHRFGSTLTLKQKFVIYPNLSNRGNYRMNFDTSLLTNINKWLGWNVGISSRYLSNPIPGAKNHDLLFTTGVRLSFAGRSAK